MVKKIIVSIISMFLILVVGIGLLKLGFSFSTTFEDVEGTVVKHVEKPIHYRYSTHYEENLLVKTDKYGYQMIYVSPGTYYTKSDGDRVKFKDMNVYKWEDRTDTQNLINVILSIITWIVDILFCIFAVVYLYYYYWD